MMKSLARNPSNRQSPLTVRGTVYSLRWPSWGDRQSPVLVNVKKQGYQVRCQWLTPVILATQEAEIRRITV
jgi:hypothetical protein